MKHILPLLAVALIAAAPAPKAQPWIQGWEKPVDPLRDCRIDREGDKLTITVSGKGHGFDVQNKRLNAPRLVREIEGDFVIQTRISSAFNPMGEDGHHRAGFFFAHGGQYINVLLTANRTPGQRTFHWHVGMYTLGAQGGGTTFNDDPSLEKPVYLRVERKKNNLWPTWSLDGKTWVGESGNGNGMPAKLKVGVVAEATAENEFKVVFDQFKLSRPEK